MKLSTIISDLEVQDVTNFEEREISDVFSDSREKFKNSLFIGVKGLTSDGASFADDAVKAGARAVIYETEIAKKNPEITYIKVKDSRSIQSKVAGLVYGNPASKLRITGITGTNGKTSTAYIYRHILNSNGMKCGLLGTTEYDLGNRVFVPSRTTPDAVFLQRYFREMTESGLKDVVMEVSSHALSLHRVEDILFDCAVFTNLTRDHLDFHGTMEEYGAAKSLLFSKFLKPEGTAVINKDDQYSEKITEGFGGAKYFYSVSDKKADLLIKNIRYEEKGMTISVVYKKEPFEIKVMLKGRFQAMNMSAAFLAAAASGLAPEKIIKSLQEEILIPGRLEKVYSGSFDVYVDYAHTPDALLRTLQTVREFCGGRILTVMGCGGNRDHEKRSMMGKIASELSDSVFVTSDNPRYENPSDIIEEIEKGMTGNNHVIMQVRKEAISAALSDAGEGDVVIIAGKGHEDYQEIGGVKYPFSDRETVRNLTGGSDGKAL